MALGILAASGQIDANRLAGHEFAGELSLSGELRPVRGALAMAMARAGAPGAAPLAMAMARAGAPGAAAVRLVLPQASAHEAALVPDTQVYGARHLLDVVMQFLPDGAAPPEGSQAADGWARVAQAAPAAGASSSQPDLADVKGHAAAKRVLEIAAAGGHSLLILWTY